MKKILYVLAFAISTILTSCSPAGQIEIAVAAASSECPIELDEATTIVDIITEDNNIVYKCVFDEAEAGMDLSEIAGIEFRKIQKQLFLNEFKSLQKQDEAYAELIKLCKEANYNIKYRMIGSMTDYKYDT